MDFPKKRNHYKTLLELGAMSEVDIPAKVVYSTKYALLMRQMVVPSAVVLNQAAASGNINGRQEMSLYYLNDNGLTPHPEH